MPTAWTCRRVLRHPDTPQKDDVDITMPRLKWTVGLALVKGRNQTHSESKNQMAAPRSTYGFCIFKQKEEVSLHPFPVHFFFFFFLWLAQGEKSKKELKMPYLLLLTFSTETQRSQRINKCFSNACFQWAKQAMHRQ